MMCDGYGDFNTNMAGGERGFGHGYNRYRDYYGCGSYGYGTPYGGAPYYGGGYPYAAPYGVPPVPPAAPAPAITK